MAATSGRVYNFSAGPAVQPEWVLRKASEEMLNWNGSGMSVMEMTHRGPHWEAIMKRAEVDLRNLLSIPANYKVLFLEGGATHQFSAIPMNLLGGAKKEADYIVTGTWSKKAIAEAKKYGTANVICEPPKCNTIPDPTTWRPFSPNAAYVYYCDNETIEGVEFPFIPETHGIPLVCDMSSNFLSRRFDVSKFGLVYACAQKNFGPAGLTIVLIREDLLAIPPVPACPTIFSFKLQADNNSMYNTPACYCIYIAGLCFQWLLSLGGLEGMERINAQKAARLYDFIDNSGYYKNPVTKEFRSRMNVPFISKNPADEKAFLTEAAAEGLVTLAGHRSVGGFRASIYNAFPEAGIEKLIEFMKAFMIRHP
ncbi:3-phosphoserine/phosphohydroxythreonine transaminase [Pelomyxa schiedti]|nr:3-phosphoserine/phosphohydroxythreonine transaminase [Pelomyxa schiedti]